ncbi:unnamed protein product [Clonostachys rosea f. rosea IK726]|uniref:Uncharacterized protein n=1 Tax=Clonostachys rosea f. rosea IK726 TaxID=1349383 RepID=A0ACA9UVV8_BIOOC|nr:unnamed protein product [Clonostachys rosea f. rosea IK726]
MPLGNIPPSTNIRDYSSKRLRSRWPRALSKKYRRILRAHRNNPKKTSIPLMALGMTSKPVERVGVPSAAGWPEKVLRENEEYLAIASRFWVAKAKYLSEESRQNFIDGLTFLCPTGAADHCLTSHTLSTRYRDTQDLIYPILLKIVYSSSQHRKKKPFSRVTELYPDWNPDPDDATFDSWVPKEYIKEPPSGQKMVNRTYLKGELTRVEGKLKNHIDEKTNTLYLDLKVKLDMILGAINILGKQASSVKGTSTVSMIPLPKPTSHGTTQTVEDEEWEDIPGSTSRKEKEKPKAAEKTTPTTTQTPNSCRTAPAGTSRKKKKNTPEPSEKQPAASSLPSDKDSDTPLLRKVERARTGSDVQKSVSAPPGASRTPLPSSAPTSRSAKAKKPSTCRKRKNRTPSPSLDLDPSDVEWSTPTKRPRRCKAASATVQTTTPAPTTVQAATSAPAISQETPAAGTPEKKKKIKVRDTIEGSPERGSAEFNALSGTQRGVLTRMRNQRAQREEDLKQYRARMLKEKLDRERFERELNEGIANEEGDCASSAESFDEILDEETDPPSSEDLDGFKTPPEQIERSAALSVQSSPQEQVGNAFSREFVSRIQAPPT